MAAHAIAPRARIGARAARSHIPRYRRMGLVATRVIVITVVLLVLLPGVLVVSSSFEPGNAFASTLIPRELTWVNYRDLLVAQPFLTWERNSLLASGVPALVNVAVTALAAFGFSRLRFWGRRYGILVLFLIQLFPATMSFVAIYRIIVAVGLINTLPGLMLAYGGVGAFNIWLFKGYIDSLPREIDEAARVDGATQWQVFSRIILPLARPMLAVVFIWTFIGNYGEYMLASLIEQSPQYYTVPLGMRYLEQGTFATQWPLFAAGGVLSTLPVLIIFMLLQRQLVSGLSRGAVK